SVPTDEEVARGLMRLLGSQGRYAEVREVHETLSGELAAHLRDASPETAELVQRLRQQAETAPLPIPEPEAPVASPAAVLLPRPDRRTVALLYKRGAQPDERLVSLLETSLRAAGYVVFMDRYLASGVEWAREIDRQIRNAYAIVPLLSPASIQSEMLRYEIE